VNWRSLGYKILRTANDVRAVRGGPRKIVRRVGRRAYGKASGRLARKLFG
jgi:hypothetical protein